MLFKKLCTLSTLFIISTSIAHATFHRWEITELYSNADGSIQFIELFESKGDDDQNLLLTDAAELSSTDGSTTNFMTFTSDLPSIFTANQFFLIGTAGYAELAGAVTPDYMMADGFLFIDGGTVNFGPGVSVVTHGALPTDGILSLNVSLSTGAISTGTNSPTNFLGATGSIVAPAVVPVPTAVWLFVSGLLGLIGVGRRRAD